MTLDTKPNRNGEAWPTHKAKARRRELNRRKGITRQDFQRTTRMSGNVRQDSDRAMWRN